ncbi:unnamed protein product, partial [Prorocentrum cordatum]
LGRPARSPRPARARRARGGGRRAGRGAVSSAGRGRTRRVPCARRLPGGRRRRRRRRRRHRPRRPPRRASASASTASSSPSSSASLSPSSPPSPSSASSSASWSPPSSSERRLHEGSRPPRRGPPARITLPVRRHPRLRLHWAGGARFSAGGRAEVACSTAHLECGLFCRCVCACADARAVTLFHHPVADSQPLVRVVVEV